MKFPKEFNIYAKHFTNKIEKINAKCSPKPFERKCYHSLAKKGYPL